MEKIDLKIIEEYTSKFENSQNLSEELENNVKQYTNGFWGTCKLLDNIPFFYERNRIKAGKKLNKPPKNKENKFFHGEHKNQGTFSNEEYFPDNIYKSIFKIEYNGNEIVPNKITWNEKIAYNKK
jgi:hypothetical protein